MTLEEYRNFLDIESWLNSCSKNFMGLQKINFPVGTFGDRQKTKTKQYGSIAKNSPARQVNFFKTSISEPVFFLQTHIHLFMHYLSQIQYLTTQFFYIDPKYRTPTTNILEYIPCYTFRFSRFGYLQQNKLLIPSFFDTRGVILICR